MARFITGLVTSDKADKTIVVTTVTRQTHPIYKKQYSVSKKIMAHDEKNEAKVGDKVIIAESRPFSARKRFVLNQIVEKAHAGFKEADATADVPQEPRVQSQESKADAEKLPAPSSKLSAKATKASDK